MVLIAVEGPDNCGKTTLISQLCELNPDLKTIKFPREINIKPINSSNFYEHSLELLDDIIKGISEIVANYRDKVILIDRYLLSNRVYSEIASIHFAKVEPNNPILLKLIEKIDYTIENSLKPDFTIYCSTVFNNKKLNNYDSDLTFSKMIAEKYEDLINLPYNGKVIKYNGTDFTTINRIIELLILYKHR
jgi:thymidylate kinase